MRVLILGATGFVGRHLLDYLSSVADVNITATVHHTLPRREYDHVQFVKAGLQNIDEAFLNKGQYDLIFHLARIPGKRFGNIGRWIAGYKGYFANKKLLAAICRLGKKPKLIYLSGSLMYGDNPGREVNEKKSLGPAGFAKYYFYAEKPFMDAIEKGAENIMMLRAPWIIGSGSWFAQLYLNSIKTKGVLPVYGNPDRLMSIITVEDCARILWHYAQKAPFSGVYNVYTFQKVPYATFINMILEANKGNISLTKYSKEKLGGIMDKTAIESVCSEIVLDTIHRDLLQSYIPQHTDLPKYIQQIVKHNVYEK